MYPYLLVAPAVIFMLLIIAYPIVNSVYMSLMDYRLFKLQDVHFVGLSNYINVLVDPIFRQSLWNSALWTILGVFFQFLFGLIMALLLNQSFKGRGVVRSLVLIPWVTPGILIGLMWKWMYDGNYGVINDILQKMHLLNDYVPWLAKSDTALFSVILTIVWQGVPFFAIMLLAGLQTIPAELYEAANVDGANRWQKFWHVTLPMLMPTIIVTSLLRIIWVSNSVDVIYAMTGGGPGYSSLTLSVYTFVKARTALDFGYSSTLSIYLTLILSVVLFAYLQKICKREARLR
ncbi:sugar ABC transporter permease [Sporomusa sp.]|uniref:carbohydrate ABC transporter permease n=1 Tax=Sporomusa sp. TaxID=2078658 RepID=UPI002CCC4184|nr:sugar ABC transporter permease [Sporomusa sp.]HWR45911.1 sugar ABC transporter permease [Sporomusa sp.]